MSVDWNVVSAISGAVAAVAALLTIYQARLASQESLKAGRLRKEQDYFNAWVVEPVTEAVKEFRLKIGQLGKEAASTARLQGGMSGPDVNRLVALINDDYYDLQTIVIGSVEHWGREVLRGRLRHALELLQDNLTTEAEQYQHVPGHDIREALNKHTARILFLIRDADPELRNLLGE